jgi:exopolyphosphatase/guanosine-5'-triphosphate,3'-diphosphate pyrophosphatase
MSAPHRAVIDVGTNSVKLLVAQTNGRDVQPLLERSKQTRLGKGFYETRELKSEAIHATAQAVGEFAQLARQWDVATIRVIATSAARDAVNAAALTSAIENVSGLPVEIISGEQEASWAFRGVTTDPVFGSSPLLLLDVGGGSTEFILGQGEQTHLARSFSLGTVRLMESLPQSDPPTREELLTCRQWVREFLERTVKPELEPAIAREVKLDPEHHKVSLVGTGGTATILARINASLETYDRERIEGARLSVTQVHEHVTQLWGVPLDLRKKIVGVPDNRADIILTGVVIYEAVMEQFGFRELRVSTRGLRFAALMETEPVTTGKLRE